MPFENPKTEIAETKELDKETVEKIESAPGINVEEKIGLILLKTKDKPTFVIELRSDVWREGEEEQEVKKDDIESFANLVDSLDLVMEIGRKDQIEMPYVENPEESVNCNTLTIYVGKDKEALGKLLKAKTSRDYGEAYGYPKTAVEHFDSWPEDDGKTLMRWELPEEERNSDYYPFIMFRMSKDNWQEEVRVAKKWASAVKRNSPKLFEEFSKLAREADSWTLDLKITNENET